MKYYNEDKLNYLLEKIQIKHLKKRYPYEISGGENQRIAVVRSLIRNPDLFLLDEPFNNLDKLTKEYTKELIFNIIKETNTTTMIVNHDIHDSLELSDRVLVLDKTKINMLDTPLKVYSEPKNLNTAKLFGELNTLKIKEKNIYFRPQDVDLVEESDIQAQVIQSKFVGIFYKTIAKVGEENVIIYHKKKLKINTEIYLDIKPKKQLNFH